MPPLSQMNALAGAESQCSAADRAAGGENETGIVRAVADCHRVTGAERYYVPICIQSIGGALPLGAALAASSTMLEPVEELSVVEFVFSWT